MSAPRRNLAVPLGVLLVLAGPALSATTLEGTIYPAGTMSGPRRVAAFWIVRLLLAGFGSYLLLKKPRVTIVHVCASGVVAAVSAVLGAALLQVLYVPPLIVSGWSAFAPASEQNELGFRGHRIDPSKDDYVILLLGDSQVEATALPFDWMPETRLQSHLAALGKRVRVFSVGTGGWGQDQELLALQEYFQTYRANLVVLWQTPGNDVWNNVFRTHMYNRNPKPTFWLDSGGLAGPTESLGQPIANSPVVVAALWQRAITLPFRDLAWERHLPEPYVPINRYEGPVNTAWQERWDTNRGRMRDEDLATEKSHMAVMLAPRSRRMQYGLELTRALTQRIEQLANANHARLVTFRADDHPFASESDEMYVLNGKYFRVSKRQFEANWRDVNRGFDAQVIPVTVSDYRVSADDGHLNREATDQVMADLANRLGSSIPDRTPEGQYDHD